MKTHPRPSTLRPLRSGYAHPLLLPALALIGLAGSAGLGTVWLREEISHVDNRIRLTTQLIVQSERNLAEVNSKITAEETIAVLTQRNLDWHLNLVPPAEPQIVHVTIPNRQLLAAHGVDQSAGARSSFHLPSLNSASIAASR